MALQFGPNLRQQIFDGHLLQILRIEPFELVAVEDAVGAAHAGEGKSFQQLGGAKKLLVSSGRPAEQCKEVAERFRQKSLGTVHVDVGSAVALREARLIRTENERHVRKDRRLGAGSRIKQDLLGRVGDVIGAANDVGNAHVDVVDHYAELIHGLAKLLIAFAGAQENKIFDFVVGKFAVAENG